MNILQKFKTIKTFVFDVDGVLTDGTLLILDFRLAILDLTCNLWTINNLESPI